jgi:hypothetical protein
VQLGSKTTSEVRAGCRNPPLQSQVRGSPRSGAMTMTWTTRHPEWSAWLDPRNQRGINFVQRQRSSPEP